METFGKVMAWLISIILNPIVNGFVLMKLWGWFMVPAFNISPIKIPVAIGIGYIIGFMTMDLTVTRQDKTQTELISLVISKALLFLLMGWIVSKFI